MQCFFCNQNMDSCEDKGEFLRSNCPHNVYMMIRENEPHLTWLRLIIKDINYQVIWYLKSSKFRIYSNCSQVLETNNFTGINPNNILEKIPLLLTFM